MPSAPPTTVGPATASKSSSWPSAAGLTRRSPTTSASPRASSDEEVISKNEPTQIFVLEDRFQPAADLSGIDRDALLLQVRGVEADILHELLHDRLEPAGADVLGILVHPEGDVGHGVDRVIGEGEIHALGFQQRGVLADQGIAGLAEDADEIGL